MKSLRALCGMCVVFFLLAGCESFLLYEDNLPQFNAPADKALVVVIRPSGMFGNPAKIYYEKKYVAGTTGNTVASFPVEPGEHLIVSQVDSKAKIKFNFQAGKVYYILQAAFPIPNPFKSVVANTLTPMPGPEATAKLEKEKGKCKFARPNPNSPVENMSDNDWADELKDWDSWAKDKPDDAKKEMEYPGY